MTITPTVRTTLSITILAVTGLIFALAAAYIFAHVISAPFTRNRIAIVLAFLAGVNLVLLVVSRLAQVTVRRHVQSV